MKQIRKWLALALCLATVLGCLAGCGNQASSGGSSSGSDKPKVEGSGYQFLVDGKSEYKILLPAEPMEYEYTAASEFNFFLAQATGIQLEIVNEKDDTLPGSGKFISIGETKLYNDNAKVDFSTMNQSSIAVKLVGDDVYLCGATDTSTVFAVYEFLEQQFNYEYIDESLYVIDKNVKNAELLKWDFTFKPSIEFRTTSYGYLNRLDDPLAALRLKINNDDFGMVGLANFPNHNYLKAVPVEKYYDEHPEWFTARKDQLCLTRDPQGIANVMAEVIKEQILTDIKNNGTYPSVIHIGHEDMGPWCSCSSCSATISKYGGYHVATAILFMNILSDTLKPWMDETGYQVGLQTFSYHETENAPVVYNEETGKYDLISEDLILRDNVWVWYAPINADYYSPFDGPNNENTYASLQGWDMITNNLNMWTYCETYSNHLVPYDTFNCIQKNYQLMAEHGVRYLYDQGEWSSVNSNAWDHFKQYLQAKLAWDAYQDIDKLTETFFKATYKDAAPVILRVFNEYKLWRSHTYYERSQDGNCHTTPAKSYWDPTMIKGWLADFQEAYGLIEKYKESDVALYNRLYKAILLEELTYRYLLINFFASECGTTDELYQMKIQWRNDAAYVKMSHYREGVLLDNLYKSWGIA